MKSKPESSMKAYPKPGKRLGIGHMYNFFRKKHPEIEVDYKTYAAMIRESNEIFTDGMVKEGLDLNMGFNLSKIGVRKQERYFSSDKTPPNAIDWKATNKLNENRAPGEKKKIVLFTSPYYFRIYWNKGDARIKNRQIYHFKPTTSANGFKAKLKKRIKEDPFIDSLYKVRRIRPPKNRNYGKKGYADNIRQGNDS